MDFLKDYRVIGLFYVPFVGGDPEAITIDELKNYLTQQLLIKEENITILQSLSEPLTSIIDLCKNKISNSKDKQYIIIRDAYIRQKMMDSQDLHEFLHYVKISNACLIYQIDNLARVTPSLSQLTDLLILPFVPVQIRGPIYSDLCRSHLLKQALPYQVDEMGLLYDVKKKNQMCVIDLKTLYDYQILSISD
jgi:hypothetical protein